MILRVHNLNVSLPIAGVLTPIVRDLSFDVARGEVLGVVGESGCGKSITALAVMGLLPPGAVVTADRFELCGRDLRGLSARRWRSVRGNEVAMIFQNPVSALNPSLTVGTQIAESVRKADPGLGGAEVRRRSLELLEQVGIPAAPLRLRAYPHHLSGGMAQRVMIAQALASQPSLLIADEPTTALDVTTQAQILDLLLRVRDENDMAIVLVSHDIGLVEECADRIMVMYSGEVVELAPAEALAGGGLHPYTRGLLSSLPARQNGPPKTPLVAIPGVVPPIGEQIPGCRFAPRCAFACERCLTHPDLVPRKDQRDRSVRCIL